MVKTISRGWNVCHNVSLGLMPRRTRLKTILVHRPKTLFKSSFLASYVLYFSAQLMLTKYSLKLYPMNTSLQSAKILFQSYGHLKAHDYAEGQWYCLCSIKRYPCLTPYIVARTPLVLPAP